jgi:hypothetical protein
MTREKQTSSVDLAVIGNSRIDALIDARASIVWKCVPRFDGDPVFCALLELGGNFPQTYSMVGISMHAKRLSRSWDDAI